MPAEDNYKFTKSHEWVSLTGTVATVGITDHAQEELGDVALVLLPEVGRVLQADEKFGEIESIKAVSDLYAPVSGSVSETNENLHTSPESVNDDPYGAGWMLKIEMNGASLPAGLMDKAEYDQFSQAH